VAIADSGSTDQNTHPERQAASSGVLTNDSDIDGADRDMMATP
jgi:hypothetical protein